MCCVLTIVLRGSKQGNLSWSLVPGSGVGAMGNCTLRVFLTFPLRINAFMYQPTTGFLPQYSFLWNLFLRVYYSWHEWYLCLFWICSLFISIYVLLVLSSCATLKIAVHIGIICAFKNLNTRLNLLQWFFFFKLDFTLSGFLVRPQTSYLQPCHIFKHSNIFCNLLSLIWSLKSTINSRSHILIHML